MSRRERKLYRDTDDQKIGGVCSGLAHYFDLDPLLVRVAFVAGLVFSGVTLIAYPLLWWLVDPAPEGYWSTSESSDSPLPSPSVTDQPVADGADGGSSDRSEAAGTVTDGSDAGENGTDANVA